MPRRPSRWTIALGLSVLGALVLWLTLAAVSPGYVADIESRKARAKWVTEQGIEDAYRMRIDYPPGNLYLFAAVGNLYRSTIDPSFDHRRASASQTLTWLIKLPPTLFHVASALVVYWLVRRRRSERVAWLSATILLFDPAAIADVAHQGQYDPVHTFFSLVAIGGLELGRPWLGGAAIAAAALTKPQAWILVPLVGAVAARERGWRGLGQAGLGGAAALAIGLAPFILHNRLAHLGRLWEYMNTNSPANQVISANAHNLWWVPTVLAGRWIADSEPLVGGLSYRWVGVGLVLLVLAACLARLCLVRPAPELFLLAAGLGAGWFFCTPRAHEYHAFFVLPFLAVAWPARPRLVGLYALASASLLANLILHDPLFVGALAAPPDPSAPLPGWYVGATLANVGLFGLLLAGLAWSLGPAAASGRTVAWRRATAVG